MEWPSAKKNSPSALVCLSVTRRWAENICGNTGFNWRWSWWRVFKSNSTDAATKHAEHVNYSQSSQCDNSQTLSTEIGSVLFYFTTKPNDFIFGLYPANTDAKVCWSRGEIFLMNLAVNFVQWSLCSHSAYTNAIFLITKLMILCTN